MGHDNKRLRPLLRMCTPTCRTALTPLDSVHTASLNNAKDADEHSFSVSYTVDLIVREYFGFPHDLFVVCPPRSLLDLRMTGYFLSRKLNTAYNSRNTCGRDIRSPFKDQQYRHQQRWPHQQRQRQRRRRQPETSRRSSRRERQYTSSSQGAGK